ncbi:MotA/TolQ/ExbB proton channel family protein [Corallococcus exiguus]|uniref:MotA/TolQ/ExbB proton channel family protein n=1 Tax=Corallococcus exiguus TaxID=83462 RepID=UPI00155FDF3C|nr:MotA/TolQ/ExbB proton channel family protein [Corallococcus exiguus]NRD59322.1 MotA/TolQ/ExbB proton channel family protein [Corallococcus exiguus]
MIPHLPLAFGAMNYVEIIRDASFIELAVLLLLMGVSVASWALIAMKATQLSRARAQSLTFLDTFWKASRLEAIYQSAQKLEGSPLSKVFCAGYEELSKLAQTGNKEGGGSEDAMSAKLGGIENVERALNRAATAQITELENRVSFLGTVGAASPFVGLFGTVIGILGAFNNIAEQGNATLATVAAPVGNALFATAAGLFAAIPAVVAYNSFVSRIKVFDTEMSNFSADFLNIIKRHFFR